MNKVLWILQTLLALAFAMAGFMKLSTPYEDLAAQGMSAATLYSEGFIHFIGAAELLGALGLVLPGLTKIKPQLTTLAAAGLFLLMLGALGTHLKLGEFGASLGPIMFGAVAGFIAWARWKTVPLAGRR